MPRVAALSDIGCRRTNNEDSFGYDPETGIYAVSDGMGGSAAGEIASHITIQTTLSAFRRMLGDHALSTHPVQHLLYYTVQEANSAVYLQSLAHAQYAGMGATLVALCLSGRNAVIANVGDSRAYLLRAGQAAPITLDHSLGAEQMRKGYTIPENDPSLNVITRAIGVAAAVEPDLYGAELQQGDRLLLASDGLMKHLDDSSIARIATNAPTVDEACQRLVEAVKALGATDNVTCLLLEA